MIIKIIPQNINTRFGGNLFNCVGNTYKSDDTIVIYKTENMDNKIIWALNDFISLYVNPTT